MEELRRKLIELKIITEKGCGYRYNLKLKNNVLIYNEVIQKTYFLNEYNVSIQERLFYIRKLINEVVLCNNCNKKKVSLSKDNYLRPYCSIKCGNSCQDKLSSVKKTNLQKYGYENPFCDKKIQEQIKKTNLKLYDTEHPLKNKNIHDKVKTTNLNRHGVKYGFQIEQTKQTNLNRYGCENPFGNKHIQEKIKLTNLNRYGCENPFGNKHIQEKIKLTNLEKYNVEYVTQNKEVQEKIRKTCLKRYGVEYPLQNKEVQEKTKQSNLKRYGVEYPIQSKEIKNKVKHTNLERYGNNCSLHGEYIKEKTKQSNLKRYGVEFSLQNKDIREKGIDTNLKKYNRNSHVQKHIHLDILDLLNCKEWLILQHHIKKKSLYEISFKLKISDCTIGRYFKKYNVKIYKFKTSFCSTAWLNQIMQTENIYIQHARNEGEYRIPNTRYYADGYCKETNTIYEFHGDFWHGNPRIFNPNDKPFSNYERTFGELYDKIIKKEQKLKDLGYNLITIWESEWNKRIKL